ncbi:hypothetical protein NE237_011652 [Protea cynaroides]|uniref:Uncharacterized protein n=1 Tax=Protea cynaroides TaxID=273540 RepID=A0A9Q0GWG9_9MAGN|nr:hypothetical protein NE237_011652 [Protea cynaroides]
MAYLRPQSAGGDRSIGLQIDNRLGNNVNSGGTEPIFSPIREDVDQLENIDIRNADPGSSSRPTVINVQETVNAPEKKLTLFALQLAVLEKVATMLGALGFIWATVVLLGGFAVILMRIDFWFITIILLIEGARIFSRSHEIEWQHQSTWTIADASIHSFTLLKSGRQFIVPAIKKNIRRICLCQSPEVEEKTDQAMPSNQEKRTWRSSEVPLLPGIGWFSQSKNISRLFYWLQFLSAIVCITLSIVRIIQLSHGDLNVLTIDYPNLSSALYIFYGLALAEGSLSLLEKIYWEWTISYRRLLEEVNKECCLGIAGMISIKRFFYEAYSECLNGSIFDGIKLDLVSYATELLTSHSIDEQLIGARILQCFSTNPRFSYDTLRKIGTSISVIERLVEMLNWKNLREVEMRRAAAEIVAILAGKKQNSLLVAGIPGAMESISSLLHTSTDSSSDKIREKQIINDPEYYDFSVFNRSGLSILKNLARDRDNCEKIGNTRGLLPKIIDFAHAGETLLKNSHEKDSQILVVKRSLHVLKLLASTSGNVGKRLRHEIVEIVFTISNIREILKHGEKHPKLQLLGIEILTSLTYEIEATDRIGSTGGIIKSLFQIFFQEGNGEDRKRVRDAAGEALGKLALKSKRNCSRILNHKELTKLARSLEDPALCISSARILRNVCTYADQDCSVKLNRICCDVAPTVMNAIISEKKNKLLEVMLGLATQLFRFMNPQEASNTFNQTGINEEELAMKLLEILKFYKYPLAEVPRMRRFAIELAISMMQKNKATVRFFRAHGMVQALEILEETTLEIESFDIFDGTVGLSWHTTEIHTLVENAIELLVAD